MRDNLVVGELAVARDRFVGEPVWIGEPRLQIGADRELRGLDQRAVVGCVDEAGKFALGVSSRAANREVPGLSARVRAWEINLDAPTVTAAPLDAASAHLLSARVTASSTICASRSSSRFVAVNCC